MDDLHGPTAEHVAGPHQHREADLVGDVERLVLGSRATPQRGALEPEPVDQLAEPAAVLGPIDRVGRGPEQLVAVPLDRRGQLERGLAAELDQDPDDLAALGLEVEDVEHVLAGQRLEVEPVARCRSRSRPSRGCS